MRRAETPSMNAVGGNTSISLSYHIAPASLTLSAGGRLQYIYTLPGGSSRLSGKSDLFYGATVFAVYFVSLGGDGSRRDAGSGG